MIKGYTHYNSSTGLFDLVFWVEDSNQVAVAGLGSLNYQVYDREGNIMSGAGSSGSGISPNAQGLYLIPDTVNPAFLNNRETYLIYVETTINTNPISKYLPFTVTII